MNNKLYFLVLVLITFLLTFLSEITLDSESLFIGSLAENISEQELLEVLEIKDKWKWLGYLILPLLLLFKVSLIAWILDLGCFFLSSDVRYKSLFSITVKSELIFLLVVFIKVTWFYFFNTDFNLEDLQYFYPLSALSLIGHEGIEPWFIYPLQVLNLFEITYWFVLAYLIGKEINDTVSTKGLQIVASSYGVGLLIWVVTIMFLTLNMS
jgi:hypothetical protein